MPPEGVAITIAPACGQFFYYNAPVNVVQALRFDAAGRLLAVGYGGTRYGTLMTSVDGDAATARLNYDHIFQDGLE